jgi:NitT/TauT family transport system permease protein
MSTSLIPSIRDFARTAGARRHGTVRLPPSVAGLLIAFVILALLQCAVMQGWLSRFLVPPPVDIVVAIARLFSKDRLLAEVGVTFAMTFAAVGLGVLIGAPIGWALYRFQLLGDSFGSWVTALFSAPIVLLYPMYVVLFGRSNLSMIMLGATVATIPIILKTKDGLTEIPKAILNVARTFKATPADTCFRVLLPASAPTLFVGIRLGLIYALVNIVATGFLIDFGDLGGLGNLIATLYDRYDIPGMYGAIVFVVLISVAFFWITEALERWLRPR